MFESVKGVTGKAVGKAVAVVKEHPVATAALAVPAVGVLLAVGIVVYQRRSRRPEDPDGLTAAERDKYARLSQVYHR